MKKEKQFIRKIFIWISVMVLSISGTFQMNSQEVQAASTATIAKKTYATFLSKSVNWDGNTYLSPSDLKFGLIDINSDKVPELYVYTKKWNYHYDYKLYGYVNGKVKCLHSFNRYKKMGRVYFSRGVFTDYGTGLKYGSSESTYFKYANGKASKKAGRLYSGYTGRTTYSDGYGRTISLNEYNSILEKLLGGAEYTSAPKLYNNTEANRNAKLKAKTTTSKVKFKKIKLWAFSNGGFYLKVTSIKGNKMKVSIHMPKMDRNNISAMIASNGKKATANFKCADGGNHSLIFTVSGNGIKVTEKSYCDQKLIGCSAKDESNVTITHGFYPQSHFFVE